MSYHITPKSNCYDGIFFSKINWKKTSWQGKLEHLDIKYVWSITHDFKKEIIAKSKEIVQHETKAHIKENKIVDAKVDTKNL